MRIVIHVCIWALALTITSDPTPFAEEGNEAIEAAPAVDREMLSKLQAKINVEYDALPLRDVLAHFSREAGIRFRTENGVNLDDAVTIRMKNITVEKALTHILRFTGNSLFAQKDALRIASLSTNKALIRWEMYNIDEILNVVEESTGDTVNNEAVVRVLKKQFSKEIEDDRSIFIDGNILVVKQRGDVHDEIREYLDSLAMATPSVSDAHLVADLEKPKVGLDFTDAPLEQCVEYLHLVTGKNFIFDRTVDRNRPVTVVLNDVSLLTALNRILKPMGYGCRIKDDAVCITSMDRVKDRDHCLVLLKEFLLSVAASRTNK